MDLSSATFGQERIITTLDAPLSVAAGAGSGKTFTLTNRIAYALIGNEDEAVPFIEGLDEVLAITFSRTGAAEMKSRIRRLLQEEGLYEQARSVEDAWIATIHGMCSRILREHALELGIDPSFETVEGARADELWKTALDSVLQDLEETGSNPRVDRLFAWYPQNDTPQGPTGIATFLTMIREKTLSLPRGFESVYIPQVTLDLGKLLREMIEMGESFRALSETWDKVRATDQKHLDLLQHAFEVAAAYQSEVDLSHASLDDPGFDIEAYFRVVLSFPPLSEKYRADKDDADFFEQYRQTYARIVDTIMQALACVAARDALDLACSVDQVYQALKGPHRLDTTDLLRMCCRALEEHPEICRAYQERFKLIMVDEFQDTDLLQVAIIDLLSRDHGANVMTVGDAQQSIYRFRGADVEVFFQHRNDQARAHSSFEALSLPDNFRSHGDILKFVDTIFARPSFFGDEFLSLQPRGKINSEEDPIFQDVPRVEVDILEYRKGKNVSASSHDACIKAARSVAQHFSRLREKGAKPGNMALLLGRMKNVEIYSRALAEVGFESIITAGSVFAKATEVNLVSALVSVLADRLDSNALFQVLSSPLFNLSDDALYALAHWRDGMSKTPGSRSFAQRFWALAQRVSEDGNGALFQALSPFSLIPLELTEIERALSLMRKLVDRAEGHDLYYALHSFFVDSGWLYRLHEEGAEGQAIAANLFKALEIIHDWQNEGMLLPEIAHEFVAYLSVSTDQPGVLSTPESDYVRIMTIHASKGLEFDHVAVGEIRSGVITSLPDLRIDSYSEDLAFLLKPRIPESFKDTVSKVSKYRRLDSEEVLDKVALLHDLDPLGLSDFLTARIRHGELDDAQRLLYVALTRAVKSLFLSVTFDGRTDFDYSSKGIAGLLHEVFNWDLSTDTKTYAFDYGGSAPARVSHEVVLEAEEEVAQPEKGGQCFSVVEPRELLACEVTLASPRADVVSYSSIAPDHGQVEGEDERDDKLDTVNPTGESYDDILLDESLLSEDDEMFPEDMAALLKQQSATALGTAFHRLAQRTIESRREPKVVPEIPESALRAQVRACELTPEQAKRLEIALNRWLASDLCARFMSYEHLRAEVPFMLELDADGVPLFLEGEIDGLAWNASDQEKQAFFIDYKTGGNDQETSEALHEKHLLQAQCYALALLEQGFASVEANFIRVERNDPADASQPHVVAYSFTAHDRDVLKAAILSAYHTHEG